jgi:hypothetical protein
MQALLSSGRGRQFRLIQPIAAADVVFIDNAQSQSA